MPLVPPKQRTAYTVQEVAQHSTPESLWVIMNRKVYDVTAFHKRHPGGAAVMLQLGGKDATAAAAAAHKSALPGNLMWEFCIGSIVRSKPVPVKVEEGVNGNKVSNGRSSLTTLDPRKSYHGDVSGSDVSGREQKPVSPTGAVAPRASLKKAAERVAAASAKAKSAAKEDARSDFDSRSQADGAVQGSSMGSSRDNDVGEVDREAAPRSRRATRGTTRPPTATQQLLLASVPAVVGMAAGAEAEVRPIEEPLPDPAAGELQAAQALLCGWPADCALLRRGLPPPGHRAGRGEAASAG